MAIDRKEAMRKYVVDRIDDESSEQLEERIDARHDTHALAIARDIVSERGWDAAEVWDVDADMFVGEVRK